MREARDFPEFHELGAIAVGFDVAARIGLSLRHIDLLDDGTVEIAPVAGLNWAAFAEDPSFGVHRHRHRQPVHPGRVRGHRFSRRSSIHLMGRPRSRAASSTAISLRLEYTFWPNAPRSDTRTFRWPTRGRPPTLPTRPSSSPPTSRGMSAARACRWTERCWPRADRRPPCQGRAGSTGGIDGRRLAVQEAGGAGRGEVRH